MSSQTNNSNGPPLIDADKLGRLMRAARIVAGFDRMEDAIVEIENLTGVHITARTLYALERGEQKATLEQMFALMVTYRPPSVRTFFLQAMREDVRAALLEGTGDAI